MKGKRSTVAKALSLLLDCCLLLAGCKGPDEASEGQNALRGLNSYDFTKASYSATDQLGREITPMHREKTDHERYVGVFYFLWLGTHGTSAGVYDVTKLQTTEQGAAAVLDRSFRLGQKIPGTENAELGYPDGMESPSNYLHWTNEPLYGYYNSADDWVITRHIELLTMADVDFIFFDTTNTEDYAENVNLNYVRDSSDPKSVQLGRPTYTVLDTILKLSQQGWDVPKVVFYTNTKSGELVDKIYKDFYADGKYDSIWFAPFGKPMIVGTTEDNRGTNMTGDQRVNISASMRQYFDVRESQWPYMESQKNGFPWMDWSKGYNFYFEDNKAVNVNVAQHGENETSYSAYTRWHKVSDGRSSRGWNEADETIDENWQAGRNIEDQWQSVFYYEDQGKSVEMVTVTAWNEWVAWKMDNGTHSQYVDNFNNEFSRDMEMDRYYYQDNFYLQLVRNVRKYKYSDAKSSYVWPEKTVNGFEDFSDTAAYRDMEGDALARDFYGFDIRRGSREAGLIGSWYTDQSNRNDIVETRVTHDQDNVYFLITTKDPITPYESGENWMNILIKTDQGANWEGYTHLINRNPTASKTSVEKSRGGWNWESSGSADIEVSGNRMLVTVSRAALGLQNKVCFEFKVADHVTEYTDIMDYYISGDSAPIGRLRYSYGY